MIQTAGDMVATKKRERKKKEEGDKTRMPSKTTRRFANNKPKSRELAICFYA